MKFINFASSSAGNCYWLELERSSGTPVKIMLEAGLQYKEIARSATKCGLKLSELDAVLISHGHTDHARGANQMASRGFQVYGNKEVCSSVMTEMHDKAVKVIAADTYVLPFLVQHDAPDPFGYYIQTDKESVLFFTDCKFFKADLSQFKPDYILAEANYDGRTIHFALKEAEEKGDWANISRYKRLLQSHMSLSNCIKTLKKLDLSGTKSIFLIHLSDRHANENVFKRSVRDETGVNTYVCRKYGGLL